MVRMIRKGEKEEEVCLNGFGIGNWKIQLSC